MLRRAVNAVIAVFIAVNLCGCIGIAAGLAEAQRVKQTFNIPYSQMLDVVKASVKEQGIAFREAVIKKDVAEVVGKLNDERTVRIFIYRVNEQESRVAVRVSTSEAGMDDARAILEGIRQRASQINQSSTELDAIQNERIQDQQAQEDQSSGNLE